MEQITSVTGVIEALGGVYKAAVSLGQRPSTVGNWQTRKKIPPEHFLTVTEALKASGKVASPEIFGMSLPAAEDAA